MYSPPKEIFNKKGNIQEITNYFGSVQFFDSVPSFHQLGMGFNKNQFSSVFQGGESVSIKRLDVYLKNLKNIKRFSKNMENPTKNNPCGSTQSAYLTHGCLSAKKFYHSIMKQHFV